MKKFLSIALSLAIFASCIFVGGITAVAEAPSLYTTVNTYDDVASVSLENITNDNQPAITIGKTPYFGSYGATVVQDPLSNSANKVIMFDRVKGPTDKWPAAVRIYKQGEDFAHYKPKTETTYEVEFKYYVKKAHSNSDVNLQIRSTPNSQLYGNGVYAYDTHTVYNVATLKAGETTNGWVTVTARVTTPATDGYFGLFAASTNKAVTGIEIYIDDVVVRECAALTIHNFDGADKVVQITDQTTIGELEIPTRDGAMFNGVYSDANFTNKLSTTDKAIDYFNTGIYYAWNVLASGEFYCGFENYSTETNGISFDGTVTSLTADSCADSKAIKNDIVAGKYAAFELRENKAFKIVTNEKYAISFAYKSSADVKLYVGTALGSNVPGTAEALVSADLANTSGQWQTKTVEVTFNRNLADGYVPVFMLYADSNASVYFDDVMLAFANEAIFEFENAAGSIATYSSSGTMPEDVIIWKGLNDVSEPTEKDADNNILISTPAELAYVIYNGGGAGNNYKLTADIYLNDINKIDWSTGVAESGYTPNTWYDEWGNNKPLANFTGNIDGDGHIIYGMYVENKPTSYRTSKNQGAGLIPILAAGDSLIENLGIDYAYVHHQDNASAFVAGAISGSVLNIENCFVGSNVMLIGGEAIAFYSSTKGKIHLLNCYSLATMNGTFYGLLGDIWEGGKGTHSVTNCYNAAGPIHYGGNTGYRTTATNCYATELSQNTSGGHQLTSGVNITLSLDHMQGDDALTNMPLGDAYIATAGFPALKVFPIILPDCEHEYDNACDTDCNECGDIRETNHTYDNACDAECNICFDVRQVNDHIYSNACDVDCNECGYIRTVGDHVYDDEYDADCNECGAIRVVDEDPSDFDDTAVKSYLAYQSNKSANYLYVASASDLALATRLLNENSEIDFVLLNGFNATIDTNKPVVSFGAENSFVDIDSKEVRVILLTGSADADMTWFVNTALTAADDWNYVVISDEVVADRPANGVIGDADQTLWKILYDFQNKNLYLYESIGINEDWTFETSKILSYQLIGAAEDSMTYRSDLNLWVVATSTFDIVTANANVVFNFDIREGVEEYMLSTYLYREGDVNCDGVTDILDLVKYQIVVNGTALPMSRANNLDLAKVAAFIFSDPIYLPVYYQGLVSEKADEINEYLATTSENTAVYLYWTDAHWNRNYENSYKLLQYLAQTTPAAHTVFGGDVSNDEDPTADDINEWRELSLRLPNHHSAVGNHEFTAPHLAYKDDAKTSYENIYNFLLVPEFEQNGVTNSLGENQLCYYVDMESEKTRYIYLKCSRGWNSSVTYEEFKWVVESLNSTPNGWHIVMVGHEWLNGTSYAQDNSRAFGRIADAYNARAVGYTDFFSVAYDFTNAGATVEYLIGGDNHADIEKAKSAGNIPVITTETDCVRGEPTAIGGTTSENCVNVVIADYDNNKIKIVRIGRDDDMNMAMAPNGKISAQVTQDITDVDGQYLTDYIDLSTHKLHNYRTRNDMFLKVYGGSATASDYIVEFYRYDADTGEYTIASDYNVTVGVGSWTFKAGDEPVGYTWPLVYDIKDEYVYMDLTAAAFRYLNTNTYPKYARLKYKGSTEGVTVNYTTPK